MRIQPSFSVEQIVVWDRNYDKPFLKETLQNITQLTSEEYGEIEIVSSAKMEQGRAFAELIKGNIDVFIASADINRELQANPIYVPLDRGLLGFRLCLVNKSARTFEHINTPSQFSQNNLSVGLGSHWPDRAVYEDNGFEVVTSPVYNSLFEMLKLKRFDCFSRSVNEIDSEIKRFKETAIIADPHIIFIYPNADFIYISPNNQNLHKRLSAGIGLAIEDNSYFDVFEKYYESTLLKHGIYERKLMIIKNQQLSPAAFSAINRFGIASFVRQPLETKPSN